MTFNFFKARNKPYDSIDESWCMLKCKITFSTFEGLFENIITGALEAEGIAPLDGRQKQSVVDVLLSGVANQTLSDLR